MKAVRLPLLVAAVVIWFVPASAQIIDVKRIAGEKKQAVESYLGKPSHCEKVNPSHVGPSDKCIYGAGTEVVFINGLADWITLHVDAPFGKSALSAIGLGERAPNFANEFTMRWLDIANLREVSLFPSRGEKVDYVYVKAISP